MYIKSCSDNNVHQQPFTVWVLVNVLRSDQRSGQNEAALQVSGPLNAPKISKTPVNPKMHLTIAFLA